MQNILSRDIINPDVNFISFTIGRPKTYEQLCSRINQAKHLLISNGIHKGDLITILNQTQSFDTTAIMFAVFELGCFTHIAPDELWTEHGDFIDTSDMRILGFDKELRISDMKTKIGSGLTKGDLFDNAGNKWHYADGVCNVPVTLVNYFELDDQPTHDITPWEVEENDVCYLLELNGWHRYHTHKEVVQKAKDCVDIFGYKGTKVAVAKSQHHHQAFELCTLPALMSARKVFEMPIPDRPPIADSNIELYSSINELTSLSCRLIQRNDIDLVYGVAPDILNWIEENFKFKDTKFIQHEGNVYGDMSSRPICLS